MTAQALPAVLAGRVREAAACPHCGAPSPAGQFCCTGCETAYGLIRGLGLEQYYQLRSNAAPASAEDDTRIDWSEFVVSAGEGRSQLGVLVGGLHCAACFWLIEHALRAQPGVTGARLSSATRRLTIDWNGTAEDATRLVRVVTGLGYRCLPVDEASVRADGMAEERELLRCMAVAGFAAANIMLLSVSVWSGHADGMGMHTRDLFHGISALIAIPAIAYAGRPFFRSAVQALRNRRTNMDVPVSIGVLLALMV
ncbi:MAG: heavy metal translocating P-type ATPase metal-binding domain-containing protein, partial [Ferrovibrio sp.]